MVVSDTDLVDNVVIVTGGSRGIGRGLALYLAERGAKVVVTGRKVSRLEAVSAELDALGAEHLSLDVNVADRDGAFDLVSTTIERFGRLDGFVANAQTFRPVTALVDVTEGDMDTVLDTGPKGTLWGMQAAHPHMKTAGRGRIVTLGSHAGINGAAGYGPYASSKEAIRALTRVAAREWGPDGITVNCVCPVSIAHRAPVTDDGSRSEVFRATFADMPLGRDGDAIHDIAPVIGFLLSDASQFVTGQTFMVDGGALMRP